MPGEGGAPVRLRDVIRGHFFFSMRTAIEAVGHNKLRASLTSLGILFGVASVIAMLAIGKGAEQEILEQMRLLGSNNIVVTPLVEQSEEQLAQEEQSGKQIQRPRFRSASARRGILRLRIVNCGMRISEKWSGRVPRKSVMMPVP